MIPEFLDIGSTWNILPPGIHDATLRDIEQRFATNKQRMLLYEGFKRGAQALTVAQCKRVFLNGSFITDKLYPGDFDACWDPVGVESKKLDPVLLDFDQGRRNQKLKYGGEFFPSSARADSRLSYLEYFQTDRETGEAKGIIRIRLQLRDGGAEKS